MFLRIQVLRLIAAASVVAYHAQLTVLSYFGGAAPYPPLEYGSYGVDLFFVISGFIIVFIGSTRETRTGIFARRRFERVVPLYWIMTVLTFALTHIPGLARTDVSEPLQLFQSLFFVSWLNGPATYPVLNVGWTLEYEIFFYAIAALAMAVSPRPWLAAGFAMLVLVVTGQGTSFFLQNPIILEFVFGITIGVFLYDRPSFAWLLAGTGITLLLLPMDGAAWRVWAFGLPSAALVALAIYVDLRKAYSGSVLPELGNASFSIYLVHVLVISVACKIGVFLIPLSPLPLPVSVIVLLVTLLAIAAGYVVHLLIERRLIQAFHRRRASQAVRDLGAAT